MASRPWALVGTSSREVDLKLGGATAARIVHVACDHASLLGGLGDRRPRARSRPWIPPPGSTLRSLSRKAGEEKGAKEGDDVQGPLTSEGNRWLARRDMEEAYVFIWPAHRAKRARARLWLGGLAGPGAAGPTAQEQAGQPATAAWAKWPFLFIPKSVLYPFFHF
jgi:hypothetical protein